MADMRLEGISITGISCAVPKHVRYTDEFKEAFGEEAVEQFKGMVGVNSVHVADEEQTSSDLAYEAAVELLKKKKVDLQRVGALVFVTQTPDYRIPATAHVLAKRLGLPESCLAFDVNLGCSGYVYGLNIIGSLMQTNGIDAALLLVGDTSNKGISPEDRSSAMLFGDSGSATLLESGCESSVMTGSFCSDGDGFKAIIIPSGAYRNRNASNGRVKWDVDGNVRSDYELYMNGTDVFSFTITKVPRLIKRYMKDTGTSPDDYDYFVMHQANKYILQQLAKKAKLPDERVPISMNRYGNTSVTSIPITLCDAVAGKKDRIRLLMCGFGVGLSWGVVDVELDAGNVFPIIETDSHYDDGMISHD